MARPVVYTFVSMMGRLEYWRREGGRAGGGREGGRLAGFLLITCSPCIRLRGLRETTINTGTGTNRSDQ
jgi:hypothetical protein